MRLKSTKKGTLHRSQRLSVALGPSGTSPSTALHPPLCLPGCSLMCTHGQCAPPCVCLWAQDSEPSTEVPRSRATELPSYRYRGAELPSCRAAELPSYRAAELAELPRC